MTSQTSLPDRVFHVVCAMCLAVPLALAGWFVMTTLADAAPGLSDEMLRADILSVLEYSVRLVMLAVLFAFPLGIGAAVFLEERAPTSRFARLVERFISLLASVPSILYGLFALAFFSRLLDIRSTLMTSSLTLALLLFPMIVQQGRDALRSVSPLIREAALALGADRWRALVHVVLPLAMPKIIAGVLLASARALGTAAPLLALGAYPSEPTDPNRALALLIFQFTDAQYSATSAVAVVVLLAVIVVLHLVANWLTMRHDRATRRQGLSERGLA